MHEAYRCENGGIFPQIALDVEEKFGVATNRPLFSFFLAFLFGYSSTWSVGAMNRPERARGRQRDGT